MSEYLPLESDGVRLRPLTEGDAPGYVRGAVDAETVRWAHLPEGTVSVEQATASIRGAYAEDAAEGRVVRLAIADPETDEYLGLMALFDDRNDSIEIGFVIAPEHRGRRVAKRAIAAVERLAQRAGYRSVRARTDVRNVAAQRTLTSVGYQAAGEPAPPISQQIPGLLLQPFEKTLGTEIASAHTVEHELQTLLERLLNETGIPGSQAVILHRGTAYRAAAGVLSTRTGLSVTHESIFQIGSITKLWTTVLVLQLVDDGLIDLEDPVIRHAPEFRLADQSQAGAIRIIDLLQHRGGFDGDYFTDGGRGADAPQALIADLASAEMFFPPGEQFAYSNAGMVVLGRLIELKRGADYLSVVEERLFRPLALEHAVTLPEVAILHPVAVGHARDEHGRAAVMSSWQLPMSAAATGAALTMSAENLARFGEMLLRGGRTRDGVQILSTDMAELIGTRAFSLPVATSVGEGFGVGAFTFRYDGAVAFGHDGQTVGQVAGIRLVPEADLVIVVTSNRSNTTRLSEAIIDFALQRFADAKLPAQRELPEHRLPAEPQLLEGRYANHTMTAEVTVVDGEAQVRIGAKGIELGHMPAMRLHRVSSGIYMVSAAEHEVELFLVFMDSDGDGVADFVWFSRLLRREDDLRPR